jgi:flagella basal body P-ring formation protein FlgA
MRLRFLVLLLLAVSAGLSAAYEPAVILKKNTVEISKDRIYLGDVADISGVDANAAEDLSTIYIKRAALPGYSIKVTRANVENQVKKEFRAIKVTGPEYVEVFTEKAEVPGADMVETAEKYVLDNMPWKKEDVEITPPGKKRNAGIIGGTVLLKVKQDNKISFRGNIMVPVEIYVDGRFNKLETVMLLVKVKAACLIASDDIKAREPLAGRVITDKKDITFIPGNVMTDISMAANKIAKRSIIKGTVLCADMFESAPLFRRGSTVNVAVKIRNISVETTGTALGDGREGGPAKVKLESGKTLEGTVSTEGKVIIEK